MMITIKTTAIVRVYLVEQMNADSCWRLPTFKHNLCCPPIGAVIQTHCHHFLLGRIAVLRT